MSKDGNVTNEQGYVTAVTKAESAAAGMLVNQLQQRACSLRQRES